MVRHHFSAIRRPDSAIVSLTLWADNAILALKAIGIWDRMKAVKRVIATRRDLLIELVTTATASAIANQAPLENNAINVFPFISDSQLKVALNAIAIQSDQQPHNAMTEDNVRVGQMLREDVVRGVERINITKRPVV